jgi:hypothetical protein
MILANGQVFYVVSPIKENFSILGAKTDDCCPTCPILKPSLASVPIFYLPFIMLHFSMFYFALMFMLVFQSL